MCQLVCQKCRPSNEQAAKIPNWWNSQIHSPCGTVAWAHRWESLRQILSAWAVPLLLFFGILCFQVLMPVSPESYQASAKTIRIMFVIVCRSAILRTVLGAFKLVMQQTWALQCLFPPDRALQWLSSKPTWSVMLSGFMTWLKVSCFPNWFEKVSSLDMNCWDRKELMKQNEHDLQEVCQYSLADHGNMLCDPQTPLDALQFARVFQRCVNSSVIDARRSSLRMFWKPASKTHRDEEVCNRVWVTFFLEVACCSSRICLVAFM